MSYILDALRRADAERQRGAVPGLHAQPAPLPPDDGQAAARGVPLAWVLAGGGLALVMALGAWWLGGDGERVPVVAPAAPVAPVAAIAPVAPVERPATTLPLPAAASAATDAAPAPAAPVASRATTPAATPPTTVPAVPRVAEPRIDAAARPPAAPARATASAGKPAAAASAPASAPARVPGLAELPEAVRRQLPKLVVGGSMYSDDAARRLVIVNGQVSHEGDEVAPDLRLVQIRPHAAVFSFRGQSFELGL